MIHTESNVAELPHNHEGEDMKEKENVWKNSEERIKKIRAKGGFASLAREYADEVKEMVDRSATCVCCIDGRVAPFQNAVAIAGSGILIKDNPQAKERLVNSLRQKGIKKVTLHDDCGALGVYAKQKGISLDRAKADAFAWADELARLLGGKEETKTLSVDLNFHPETCAYLSFTDNFSLKEAPDFPVGFEISTAPVSTEDFIGQVELSLTIAFGDHGFGDSFTKDTPFSLVVVANNEEELQRVKTDVSLAVLLEKYDGKAVIDGFVA